MFNRDWDESRLTKKWKGKEAPIYRTGPRPNNVSWTPEMVVTLKELHAQGMAYKVIAEKMGVTKNTISGKVNGLGMARPRGSLTLRTTTKKRKLRESKKTAKGTQKRPGKVAMALKMIPGIEFKADAYLPPPSVWDALPDTPPVPLLDLSDHVCRWPLTNGFCGAPSKAKSVYCNQHHAVAYRTTEKT